jgi:hypothetical protein
MTDKGLLAILEKSDTLQSLSLTEVEGETVQSVFLWSGTDRQLLGRLHRSFWGNAITLPCTFNTLRLAFSEEGPHHS